METSATVAELAKALAEAQAEIGGALKSGLNPHFKSRYADLSEVWTAWQKVGPKRGLSVIQTTGCEGEAVYLETRLLHSSGEWAQSRYPLRPVKDDPQGYGSALTYARRYCLSAMVGIAPEDDDGNAASAGNGHAKPVPAPPTTAAMEAWIATFTTKLFSLKTENAVLDLEVTNEKALTKLKDTAPARYADVRNMIAQALEQVQTLQAG